MDTQYLYVMGSESGVGKSTVCQGILAMALASGYPPSCLAYIKPVTQCTKTQGVALFCDRSGIARVDLGGLIFRKGFTKDFIDGLTQGSEELMSGILASIFGIAKGKALVVVDGVGDPAVGSVVGVSNVDVAAVLPCRVIFVGKSGIGAAIDNTILCVSLLRGRGIENIGIIYNKIPMSYLAETKRYVSKRIRELLPEATLLGFIAERNPLDTGLKDMDSGAIARWFGRDLDEKALLRDWLGVRGVSGG